MILSENLAVGRDVAIIRAVNVSQLDVQRVRRPRDHLSISAGLAVRLNGSSLKIMDNLVEHILYRHHPLRAAEATERSVRRIVGKANSPAEIDVGNVVG